MPDSQMSKREFQTIREFLYWHYANLAMAHAALSNNHTRYTRVDFMIRAKLYKGLLTGTHNISSMYADEKNKLHSVFCAYCGSKEYLTMDHLIARHSGGTDHGDNLVYACSSCNSSKGKKDLLEWYIDRNSFPPILVLRRYLKLAISYFEENQLMDCPFSELGEHCQSFKLLLLPDTYPAPDALRL